MSAIVELRSVARVHGSGATAVYALRGVSLAVEPGELVSVMGPSGSGKSTLLTLAGGLDSPTGGEVVLDGVALSALPVKAVAALRRRAVGYVFQDLNLIPALTAVENVALPRELDGIDGRAARREALAVLEEVGIAELADRFPDDLSGGEQQRIAIARAIVGARRLILADEPTGALDSQTGEAVLRTLRERIDAGAAGILVTHEARHAAWADRVVFLRDGSVIDETGPPAVERGYRSEFGLGLLVLVLGAAIITLGAAGIATGLAQADARPDHATLAAVGADPRMRRSLAAMQALAIAGIGSALGVAAGFVPALALVGATPDLDPVVPWTPLLALLAGVPLLAAAAAWLCTRSRMPMDRRLAR
jgi:putative ABC transport system ATP-binding protein